jgi:hypothetical protein
MRASALLSCLCLWALAPRVAKASPSTQACVDAYEATQTAMRRGKLLHAREALATCLDGACAQVLRSDCAEWLKDVEARTPSVVVECVSDGVSVRGVGLSVDGVVRATGIDGRAIEVDPGRHVFTVEPRSGAPIVTEVIVSEGEKLKVIRVELPSRMPQGAPPQPAIRLATRSEPRRPVRWTVYAATGVGALAATGFTFFAAWGASGKGELDACRPDCSASSIDDVRRRFVAADIFLGVSVIALGTAGILFLTRPSVSSRTPAAGLAGSPLSVQF